MPTCHSGVTSSGSYPVPAKWVENPPSNLDPADVDQRLCGELWVRLPFVGMEAVAHVFGILAGCGIYGCTVFEKLLPSRFQMLADLYLSGERRPTRSARDRGMRPPPQCARPRAPCTIRGGLRFATSQTLSYACKCDGRAWARRVKVVVQAFARPRVTPLTLAGRRRRPGGSRGRLEEWWRCVHIRCRWRRVVVRPRCRSHCPRTWRSQPQTLRSDQISVDRSNAAGSGPCRRYNEKFDFSR